LVHSPLCAGHLGWAAWEQELPPWADTTHTLADQPPHTFPTPQPHLQACHGMPEDNQQSPRGSGHPHQPAPLLPWVHRQKHSDSGRSCMHACMHACTHLHACMRVSCRCMVVCMEFGQVWGDLGVCTICKKLGLQMITQLLIHPLVFSTKEAATLAPLPIGMGVPGWGGHCPPGGGDERVCRFPQLLTLGHETLAHQPHHIFPTPQPHLQACHGMPEEDQQSPRGSGHLHQPAPLLP
jgi:hypothetical protein